ncbi:MAG: winged helix-turn-helix domain-containing tetratricopeptide repeat protein [Acidobacteriota bacterium]
MSRIVRFGDFEVDLAAGQLRKRGLKIGLREKSFQILASLIEQPGEVVTREQLQRRLWPSDVFVDFENNLNTAVARLREALGDSADHPRFIETLPKHGYRFLAKVSDVARPPERSAALTTGLVVLPFVDLSESPQEYFSDAITDEIITELASLAPEALRVIARTTAMRYKRSQKDAERIGRELGVEYIVEGSVHRTPERIGVNVQLVRTSDQMHVFARRYDAALRDLFTTQSAIARDIAEHLDIAPVAQTIRASLAGRGQTRNRTDNLAAYEEYVQGRFHVSAATPDAIARGRQHFEAAIARDPAFALAYDSLAEIYWYLGYFGFMPPRDAFATGVLYAVRALEIDNTLGETHALLGQYHKQLDYNWPEVDREMARALELSPASPIVRVRYAFNALMPRGRLAEAVAELERARALDPLSPYVLVHLGALLVLRREGERTRKVARQLLDLDPHAYWGHLLIGASYRDDGRFVDAIAAGRRATEVAEDAVLTLGWLGLTLGLAGEVVEARALLDRLHSIEAHRYVPPSSLAWVHLGLREYDEAFEWLDRAIDARDQLIMPIKTYAFLDPIRTDPRFLHLLRKMHLDD